jgi:hypothetical protein
MTVGIEVGSVVVIYLGAPREQVFGVVLSMGPAGVVLRGISVASVDDWLRSFGVEDGGFLGAGLGLSTTFFPMHRIERLSLDEPLGGIPPIHERFKERTGMSVEELVGLDPRDEAG